MDSTVFQFIGTSLDRIATAYITDTSVSVIGAVTPVVIVGVTLYITLYGYLVLSGKVQEPFTDFMIKCAKIVFITVMALNSDFYLQKVVEAMNGLESGLSVAVNNTASSNIYTVLDASLNKGMDLVASCFDKGSDEGFTSVGAALGWYISGVIIGIGTFSITAVGGASIILAKIALAILFGLGPLFIVCLMWPATARFFDSWIGLALNYILSMVLVASVLAFGLKLYDYFVSQISFDSQQNMIVVAMQLSVLTYAIYRIVREVSSMASSLGGGISIQTMGITQIGTAAAAPGRAISRAVNPTLTRLDPKTGLQTSSSRLEHMAMGRSIVAPNPAYRQALQKQLQESWGRQPGGSIKGKTGR